LEELLQDIEHSVRPLYITRHYVEPGMRDYYTTEVHLELPQHRQVDGELV
jgi:hypothetical protein